MKRLRDARDTETALEEGSLMALSLRQTASLPQSVRDCWDLSINSQSLAQ